MQQIEKLQIIEIDDALYVWFTLISSRQSQTLREEGTESYGSQSKRWPSSRRMMSLVNSAIYFMSAEYDNKNDIE